MYVPALAARAPLGPTKTATGTREARIALMISRIEVSSPPGVSICSTTSCAPSRSAREPARHIVGGRRSDRAGKRQYERRRRRSAGRAGGKREPRRREKNIHHLHAKRLAESGMDVDYCRKRARPCTDA